MLCYAVAMLRYGIDRLSVGFGLILVLIALFAFGYRIIAGAHAAGGALLTVGMTAYIVALGSAVVLGRRHHPALDRLRHRAVRAVGPGAGQRPVRPGRAAGHRSTVIITYHWRRCCC